MISKSNQTLKKEALEALKGNWQLAILITLVCGIIEFLGNIEHIGLAITLLIALPMSMSYTECFLKIFNKEECQIKDIFSCFSKEKYSKYMTVSLLVGIFTFLWSLLFVIPGIIKYYSYSMSQFIALEHPEMGANECIDASKSLMKGKKLDLFLLDLSFIGWGLIIIVPTILIFVVCGHTLEEMATMSTFEMIASIITGSILSFLFIVVILAGWLMLTPYVQTTHTAFYKSICSDVLNLNDDDSQANNNTNEELAEKPSIRDVKIED